MIEFLSKNEFNLILVIIPEYFSIVIDADILIKATKVDGVYNKDPVLYPDAIKYSSLSFDKAIAKKLKIMDISAFDLCREHNMNIQVCNIFNANSLINIVLGHVDTGTFVHF